MIPSFYFPLLNWKRVCFLAFSSDSSSAASFLAKHSFSICKLTMCFKNLLGWDPIFLPYFLKSCWLPSYLFFLSDEGRATEWWRETGREREGRQRARKRKWFEAILLPPQPDWLPLKKFSFHQHSMNTLRPRHSHINYVSSPLVSVNISL